MQVPFVDPFLNVDVAHQSLPLVGRETEKRVVRLVLNTVLHNLPVGTRALTISGEMGVGKSRLLAEMLNEALTMGFRVFEGRTYALGRTFPYLPFIEALRPFLRSATTEQLRRYMGLIATPHEDGEQEGKDSNEIKEFALVGMPLITALSRLLPELLNMVGVHVPAEVLSPEQEKFRLMDAVATLLERVAMEQPVLLAIDNMEWADSASLELTLYLTVRLHSSRVALVGVTRPPTIVRDHNDEEIVTPHASRNAAKALSELIRQRLLFFLPLGPLDREAMEQHMHALLPGTLAQGLAQRLLERAEGNPFFLEELVRTVILHRQLVLREGTWYMQAEVSSALPESITLAVRQRLNELSIACRELLRVAALFGRTFPLIALQRVCEQMAEDQVLTLIEEATQAQIVALMVPTDRQGAYQAEYDSMAPVATSELIPASYMFCQGIVQEVLRAEVPAARVRSLHSAIGTALETMYAATAMQHAAELAQHYTLGGPKAAALRWNLLAGEEAAQRHAHREAIGHFRLAIRFLEAGERVAEAPSLPRLFITTGELWFKLGELELAAQAFQSALEKLPVGMHMENAAGGSKSPLAYPSSSRYSPEVSLQIVQANRLMADVYRMQGKYDQALAHLEAARTALDASMSREGNGTIGQKTHIAWFPGRSFAGSGNNALTLARVSASERILLLQAQATLDILSYRAKEAEKALWQSHQLATEMGDRGSQAFALHLIGWLRGWGEHIHEAIRLQEQAHGLYVSIGDPFHAALGEQGLGIIYLALGEIERARQYTQRGLERARQYGVRYTLGWLYWNCGVIALAEGKWAESEAHLQEAYREAEETQNTRLQPMVMQAQAEVYFRQGKWPQAESAFQESIQAAANTEWYVGTLALYGHFLAVTGRRTAAQVQLKRAAAQLEPLGYGGDFYLPFLAEGYLHLEAREQAATYIERIRSLQGFMYYGNAVDRILGVVEIQTGNWERAELAFEAGLALCRRVRNAPEEAAILYEQARAALMQSGMQSAQSQFALQRIHDLCERARGLFQAYGMQRSVELVDTLQAGVSQLVQQESHGEAVQVHTSQPMAHKPERERADYHLDLSLTRREQEVLRLVAEGHTDREVAELLVISPRTVNRHLSNIFVKLDVPGRAAAVAYAVRQGLV